MNESVGWPALERDLIAILRGISPEEAGETVRCLIDEGFRAIEIPLNSPEPFRSIEIAAKIAPAGVLIGAGTVLSASEVERLADAGGRLAVSPNLDPAAVARSVELGMVSVPGVFTATEAFTALATSASALKFFPAGVLGPSGLAALKAVLPPNAVMIAVGGVGADNMAAYAKAGIRTFGFGSSLYRSGQEPTETARRARMIVAAYDRLDERAVR